MPIPLRAFVMPYVDKSLVSYPASCWIPDDEHTDLIDGDQTAVQWMGYATMQDLLLKAAPIDQHTTQITGPQYVAAITALTATAVGETEAEMGSEQLAAWGLTTLDTPATNPDGTPQLDAQGQPVMRAFFAGAQIVPLG